MPHPAAPTPARLVLALAVAAALAAAPAGAVSATESVLAPSASGAAAAPALASEPIADATHERPGVAAELVIRSLALLGVHYRFGGNSPERGLDCSGLVRHVVEGTMGLVLPRRAEEISRAGESVQLDQLRPGDLVFFNTLRRAFSHVGVYIGDKRFVHAPARGGEVRVENIDTRYWMKRFDGARRLAESGDPNGGR